MKEKRINKILQILKIKYPKADTSLHFKNPLQILVATILSAQCTDARVNIVTKNLFKKYKTAKDYAEVSQEELEQDIRSTGFYKNKTKNIRATGKILQNKYKGKVPKTMEQLIELSGVARKTANVVLGAAFHIVSGVVVDTHVKKFAYKTGLSEEKDPVKIEKDLMKILPKKEWITFPHRVIAHGRNCKYKIPNCKICKLVVK